MAIKLRNIGPDVAIWGMDKHQEHNGLIRESSITISNADGSITGGTINFGRIGDNNITRLGFDLKDFKLTGEEDDYEATLLFKSVYDDIGHRITLERCGKNQFCRVLTSSDLIDIYNYCGATNIKMIVVIEETANSNEYDNVPGIREQFVSNEFSGYFTTNNALSGNPYWNPFEVPSKEITILKDTDENNSLLKQDIIITLSGDNLSANTTLAGNQYDSYVKRIVLNLEELLVQRGWNNVVVSMLVSESRYDFNLYTWDGSKAWLPEELTATPGTKPVWFKITSGDKEYISNMLTLTVKENWLDGFFTKEIILTDINGEVLIDSNGEVLHYVEDR